MNYVELNLDGLVGPTHHYAGLAEGNIASQTNALSIANPRAAALQGLAKMRFLHDMGLNQAVLPPHQRPNLQLLSQLGFQGSLPQQLQQAKQQAPALLSAAFSASSMWTANAATVSPSLDSQDNKVHFTAANLISNLHRHQEADFSKQLLERIFSNPNYFVHHAILPRSSVTGDEGAANHNRLCGKHGQRGLQLFVYGKKGLNSAQTIAPKIYPARQTLEACQALARNHDLDPARVIFAQQNPEAIDAGVFHNDVISVANEQVFLVHEQAFLDQPALFERLRDTADFPLQIIEISKDAMSLKEAVSSYLYNSQLLSLPEGGMLLLAPKEAEETPRVKAVIDNLLTENDNPILQVQYMDLKQSMRNGGGPACLRLRVVLNDNELGAMHQGVLINHQRLDQLEQWVKNHYRDELSARDLADPHLVQESFTALDELTRILNLGSIYPFQQ